MSRAGYVDDYDIDQWALIRWRGAVASSIRGKRGQSFLLELITALDAMPEKRLIAHDLEAGGNVCAIGSVGASRGVDMSKLDPDDPETIAGAFGIATPLVREIEYENDEGYYVDETPEHRWKRMRSWALGRLSPASLAQLTNPHSHAEAKQPALSTGPTPAHPSEGVGPTSIEGQSK